MDLMTTYPIDAENAAEMARITRQARVFTSTNGLLPADLHLKDGQRVLDIGCGPGEWVFSLAEMYPGIEIVGIDISEIMTQYARSLAVERELHFVHFKVMNAL